MLITGAWAQRTDKRLVGRCHSRIHPGFLTKEHMKKHGCLEKQCPGFERLPDAPYWVAQHKLQQDRQAARARKEEAKASRQAQRKQTQALLDEITDYTEWLIWIYDFPLEITGVIQYREGQQIKYIVNYVSDRPESDFHDYCYLSFLVRKRFARPVELRHLRLPDGRYAVFDDWYG